MHGERGYEHVTNVTWHAIAETGNPHPIGNLRDRCGVLKNTACHLVGKRLLYIKGGGTQVGIPLPKLRTQFEQWDIQQNKK